MLIWGIYSVTMGTSALLVLSGQFFNMFDILVVFACFCIIKSKMKPVAIHRVK